MKVMVLGGGGCQINLIKRLREQGDEIILVDYLPNCPASRLCDTHLLISTFDVESVLTAAKDREIEAIVTLGTDQPVLTAAKVAEALGLPFYLSPEQALMATNKRVMKAIFKEQGIPSADYRLLVKYFNENEVEELSFPVVLKPVDSQGQRGIYKLQSEDEIRKHIEDTLSFSREGKALLEEYYHSDEITVNGWLDDGSLTLLSVVDRVTLTAGNHIGICIAHNFPSLHLHEKYEEIKNLTKKIIEAFGFSNGPVYFQYLIGNESIKVNEIAMRIGGAYEDITLPLITGIDVLGMLINSIKGRPVDLSGLKSYSLAYNQRFVSTQMFFLRPGRIATISYDEEKLRLCGVKKISISRKIGDTVGDIQNATARAGYFIVSGNGFEDMIKNADRAYDELRILDEKGDNMVIRYNEYKDRYKFAVEGG